MLRSIVSGSGPSEKYPSTPLQKRLSLWYAECNEYGGGSAENTTAGAEREMDNIARRGFLNYSRAAVRLVPDSYFQTGFRLEDYAKAFPERMVFNKTHA